MAYYRAIVGVLWRTFSNFNFARGGWQSALALFQLAGLLGTAYFIYQGSWWALLAVLSAILLITAVQIQIDLNKMRHEGRGFLEIIPASSQVSADPARWKNINDKDAGIIETEKIRESTIEVALEICFSNKQSYSVDIHDFAVTLYRHWFCGFPFAEIKTETQYVLQQILEGRPQSIKPIRFSTPGNSKSTHYYFHAWVTIPSGMGAFFVKVKQPILLLHYRVDSDSKRHDLHIDIDWDLVRSKQLVMNTVLGYADVC